MNITFVSQKREVGFGAVWALFLGMAASLQASVIMLDFGPTAVGSATTQSPYHAATPGFTDAAWNTSLGTGDLASGTVVDSLGSTLGGLSINLGRGTGTASALGTQPGSSSALGTSVSSGIYGGTTSVARDALFTSTTPLTLQVAGLAAGTYEIYYVGRNTNRAVADNYTQILFGGVSAASGDFNWGGYSSDTISYGSGVGNSNVSTWVQGQNFAKLTLTVGSGEFLNLAFNGGGLEAGRGFLNSLQIVSLAAVPEPSTIFMLGSGLAGFVLLRRRSSRVEK